MDLPDGVDPATVRIIGQTMRYPASLRRGNPTLWERAMMMQRETLTRRLELDDMVPISDIHVEARYSKRVELDERPDWAGENYEPPWHEEVECAADDPEMSLLHVIMEVTCAPR
jgi:hypothetical protein